MPAHKTKLNRVFHALSDPTRRAVLARLSQGPATVSELAMPFNMTLPSFTQHMGVLETSGLVSSRKQGRIRVYQLTPTTLEAASGWIAQQQKKWVKQPDRQDNHQLTKKEET